MPFKNQISQANISILVAIQIFQLYFYFGSFLLIVIINNKKSPLIFLLKDMAFTVMSFLILSYHLKAYHVSMNSLKLNHCYYCTSFQLNGKLKIFYSIIKVYLKASRVLISDWVYFTFNGKVSLSIDYDIIYVLVIQVHSSY